MTHEQTICRLCLKSCDFSLDIFDSKGINGLLVWRIIKELTELEVTKNDGLPKTICEECMRKIAEFKHFKTMCINSGIEFLKAIANRGLVGGDTSLDRCGSFKVLSDVNTSDSSYVSDIMDMPGGDRTTPLSVDVKPNVSELRKRMFFSTERIGSSRNVWISQSGMSNSLNSMPSVVWRDTNQISIDQSSSDAHSEDSGSSSQIDVLCTSGEQSARTNDVFNGDLFKNMKSPASKKWYKKLMNQKSAPQSLPTCTSTQGNVQKEESVGSAGMEGIKVPEGLRLKKCHVALTDVMKNGSFPYSPRLPRRSISAKPSPTVALNVSGHQDSGVDSLSNDQGGPLIAEVTTELKTKPSVSFEIPLYCDECMAPFVDKPSLKKHINLCHLKKTSFCCKVCFKTYVTKSHLEEHFKEHFAECQQYRCTRCHASLQSRKSLAVHILKYHRLNSFNVCKLCKRAYISTIAFHKHACTLWKISYKCSKCDKVLRNISSYKFHVLYCQMGVPVNICPYCGQSFKTLQNYSLHLKWHVNDAEYSCTKCGKKVGYRKKLLNHSCGPRLNSVGPSTNSCTSPEAGGSKKSVKFPCTTCGKCFASSASLRRHISAHTRLTSYHCPFCFAKFKFMRSRFLHVTLKHPECPPEVLFELKPTDNVAGGEESADTSISDTLVDESTSQTIGAVINEIHDLENQPCQSVLDCNSLDRRHQCKLCGKRMVNLASLTLHERSHQKMTSYHLVQKQMVGDKCQVSCPKCPARFKFPVNRLNHMKTKHPNYYLSMLEESKVSSDQRRNLTDAQCVDNPHGITDTPSNEANNPTAVRALNVAGETKEQVSSVNPLKEHLCNVCDRTFLNLAALVSHKKTHLYQKIPRYKCHFCPLSFVHAMNRMVHIRTFHPGAKDTSKVMPQKSIQKANIGEGYGKCPHCPSILNLEWGLKLHLQNKHSLFIEDKTQQCHICGKQFKTRRNLNVHMIVHSAVMPYACRFCPKTFRFNSNCKSHMRKVHWKDCVATGDKAVIQSDEEGAEKVENSSLNVSNVGIGAKGVQGKSAEPITLSEEPKEAVVVQIPQSSYWCHYCPEIFTTMAVRDGHERVMHAGYSEFTRMLKCYVCSKTFKRRKVLFTHLLTHSSFPRYQCEYCGGRFKNPSSRGKHVRAVHHSRN